MRERIQSILSRYFECDLQGNRNQSYDPMFSAQEAIDAIAQIVMEKDNG